MPKYRIVVTEKVLAKYKVLVIEDADSEEDAQEQADVLRGNGDIGRPDEEVTSVEFAVDLIPAGL